MALAAYRIKSKIRNVYIHDASIELMLFFAKVSKMAFDKPLSIKFSVHIHMQTKMHNQNPRLKLGGHQIS